MCIRDSIERMSPSDWLCFIVFFPVFTSGPIDRSRRFVEDLHATRSRDEYAGLLARGIVLIAAGMVYKMVIAAPEYLCDAIRIIRLHDHVAITKDGNAYEAYNFTPSYQWNDVGDLAQVTITFESNTVLQKISAYKGSQSVFKNALLAAASVPIMFSPNVIAQYGASVDGVAEAYTEFTGKLIRQLEEQTTLPKEAWVAIDTGTGEAKKMSIGLLGGGTGKPSELWTNDKKIKYLYIKEDNSEAYITKQFIGDSNIMAKGDICLLYTSPSPRDRG